MVRKRLYSREGIRCGSQHELEMEEWHVKEIKAAMAGTVFKVEAAKGQDVSQGQPVVILESMKMEIPVESPDSGKVAELKVAEGDFVDEGDVLIILE